MYSEICAHGLREGSGCLAPNVSVCARGQHLGEGIPPISAREDGLSIPTYAGEYPHLSRRVIPPSQARRPSNPLPHFCDDLLRTSRLEYLCSVLLRIGYSWYGRTHIFGVNTFTGGPCGLEKHPSSKKAFQPLKAGQPKLERWLPPSIPA